MIERAACVAWLKSLCWTRASSVTNANSSLQNTKKPISWSNQSSIKREGLAKFRKLQNRTSWLTSSAARRKRKESRLRAVTVIPTTKKESDQTQLPGPLRFRCRKVTYPMKGVKLSLNQLNGRRANVEDLFRWQRSVIVCSELRLIRQKKRLVPPVTPSLGLSSPKSLTTQQTLSTTAYPAPAIWMTL